jgi:hypothetical protein
MRIRGTVTTRMYPCVGVIFPCGKRLVVFRRRVNHFSMRGMCFFNLSKNQRIGRVFWELLEMLLGVDISCYIKQDNAYYAYS